MAMAEEQDAGDRFLQPAFDKQGFKS